MCLKTGCNKVALLGRAARSRGWAIEARQFDSRDDKVALLGRAARSRGWAIERLLG